MLVNFRVELRWNSRENEFAMSSVRFQSLTLNSGVARTRLGCETTLRRTQVVWGRRSKDQFNQFSLLTTEMRGLPRGAGWCLESYGGKEAYYPMLKAVSGHPNLRRRKGVRLRGVKILESDLRIDDPLSAS